MSNVAVTAPGSVPFLVDGKLEIHTPKGDYGNTGSFFQLIPGCCSNTGVILGIAVFPNEPPESREWLVVASNYSGCPSGGRFHEVVLPLSDVEKLVITGSSMKLGLGAGETRDLNMDEIPRFEPALQRPNELFASAFLTAKCRVT